MSGVAPFTERPTHLAKGRWIGDFGKLSPLERQLLAHVAAGKRLVIATSRPKGPSARNRIRADLIRFLVLGGDQTSPVHELGIEISGAWITGRLNLAEVSSSSCLVLLDCHFTQPVIALGARLAGLFLSGSFLPGLNAQGIDVKGGVFLNGGFTADGEVSLSGAQIGGQLSCEGGTFRNCDNDGNSKGDALIAQGIDVKGDVFLQGGFTADGEVSLAGGKIGGELSCSGSTFRNCDKDGNAKGDALNAQGIDVKGSVFLADSFTAEGQVRLSGAIIGGQLSCNGSTFRNCDSDGNAISLALNAQGIDVKGDVFLQDGLIAYGEVNLAGAKIGGQLSCVGGRFSNCDNDGNSKGLAINAQTIDVKGGVFLKNGFTADGEVSLSGAQIGGQLSCIRGRIRNCDKDGNAIGMAINAQGIDVKGSVFLRDGFTAEAEVSLSGAQIGGQLSCEGSTFRNCDSDGNAQGMAINAQDIDVKGSVHLRGGFIAEGEVSFIGAQIGGQVSCNGGTFRNCDKDGNAKGIALNAQALVIKDGLIFKPKSCIGGVDLTSAAIADLVDNSATWPRGRYYLSGLRYERLHGADTIEQRIDWLRGQTPRLLAKDFAPQPWEQLIRVQREMGHPHAARKVAIAKQKAMRRAGIHGLPALKHRFPDKLLAWASVKPIGRAGWEWFTLAIRHPLRFLDELRHDLFGILTGYGHAPWRALSWTLAFWLIFAGLYWDIGIGCTALLGCDSHFGPALTYSADALLPVDLGLVKASLPISDTPFPQSTMPAFRALTIMENLTGWVLGILILAMIGNLIRKD